MAEINSFKFNIDHFDDIKKYHYGDNWPVVYLAENGREAYVGESINVYNRSRQHYENPERRKLTEIHIITDEEFNKSAALDIESWLIQYMVADGKFLLQNGNGGLKNHEYFDRPRYKAKFELTWQKMRERGLARKSLEEIDNSDLFKYSPYKSLSEDQHFIARQLERDIEINRANSFIVYGEPGTGKTILATYLIKHLQEKKGDDYKIALVIPMVSLRKTLKKVFRNVKGLSSGMVIGPNDVVREEYDLLIIDEAHRLRQRRNITNYRAFDNINEMFGLGNEGSELDWIRRSSKKQVFFYDPGQSVRPSDISHKHFKELLAEEYVLSSQMRINAGENYISFIDFLFQGKESSVKAFDNYEFKIYDDAQSMFTKIKEMDVLYGLSRIVAGYAWPWNTRNGEETYDIEIDGLKAVWNSTPHDWVNSENAVNEVGCIHTVQGYDLNYVGVIIGPEFGYDPIKKEYYVDRKKYYDRNGHAGVSDPEELLQYIKNIYKTLLTRGIRGTFVYICDPELRKLWKNLTQ